jgi:hypothetical protein
MPVFKKRSYKKRATKKRVRGGRKSSAGVSAAVKSYVNRTVHAQIEDKDNSFGSLDNIGTIYAQPTMNVVPCFLHPLTQGDQEGQRIGNQIRVKTLIHKYILFPTAWDVTVNPFPQPTEVIMWWGRLKRSATEAPTAADFQRLFQFGAAAVAPTGDLRDCIAGVNKDLFTIFATRRHKLGNASILGATYINPADQQYFTNNDFKLNIVNTINLTKHMKKVQKYDDDDIANVGQSQVFNWVTAVNSDGTLNTATTLLPVQYYSYFTIKYEDA